MELRGSSTSGACRAMPLVPVDPGPFGPAPVVDRTLGIRLPGRDDRLMMVVALGEEMRIRGYALAAVRVVTAERPDEVVAAWERLPPDVAVLLLTPMARSALAGRLEER